MLSKLVFLLLLGLAQAQISINYLVQYNEDNGNCGGTDLEPVTTTVPYFSTALDIMESAVSMGVEYQFEIRFSGEGGVGYVVDVLNGTRAIGPCYWVFYVLSPVGLEYRSNNIDISTYHVPDNYSIVLRYEKIAPNTYTTLYTVEHPDPFCTNYTSPGSIAVTTPRGSSALNVMEQAVRDYGSSFSFSTSYVGTDVGYTILQINDIKTTSECSWVVFVTPSGGVETRLTTSLSLYIIPTEDHRLTLRFMEPVLPTTLPTAATTSGTKGLRPYGATAVQIILSCILLVSLFFEAY